MAVRETPAAKIDRLLNSGQASAALEAADELLAQSPNSFLGRLGRTRANLRLSNHIDAEADIEIALRLSPRDELANLVRANMDHRLGKIDAAIGRLQPIASGRGAHAIEAAINLVELYHYTGRRQEMLEFVHRGGAWLADPRALLVRARVRAFEDLDGGVEEMKAILRGSHPLPLRRVSGFEAVGLLDRAGRFRDAFDLATEVHASTGARCELEEWTLALQEQLTLLRSKGRDWIKPRVEPVQGVAMVVAMPRSGTTLLEQMLDSHPEIGGIGEFDGLDTLVRQIKLAPGWPRVPQSVPRNVLLEAQQRYLAGARHIRKAGATWTFDKTLLSWRALPEVAAALPGTFCISVDRDPRDMAVSQFLSYFNPLSYAWTQRFDLIRTMVEYQREVVPQALEMLDLPHESIVYEDLVEDPEYFARRCLHRMGLAMDERVLRPESNTRGAFTLSHAQVRQKINKGSIGRWKNYEWAFDGSWDAVVAAHDARRQHR